MTDKYEKICKTLDDTKELAQKFARIIEDDGCFINLYGEIGAGHFDLYRLENEGVKTIFDELREYSEGKQITFVEWAEFSQNQVPFEHIKINVTYDDNDYRKYSFEGFGDKCKGIIEQLRG